MSRNGRTDRASTRTRTRPVTLPFRLASSAASDMMKVTFTISAGSTSMLPTWIHEVAPSVVRPIASVAKQEQEAAHVEDRRP